MEQPTKTVETDVVTVSDLKNKSVVGGAISLISNASGIFIQLVSTIVLARLLSPSDYGVIAMVVAVTSFAGIFRDMGLSWAAIQAKELTGAQQSNLFWLNIGMGMLLSIIVAAISPLVGWFYGKPELIWVTLALSSSFLLASISTQHGAMLVRNMQFGRKAVAQVGGNLVTLLVSAFLAYNGWSYWSLVIGNLSGILWGSVIQILLAPFRPGPMSRRSGIGSMLKFGVSVTTFDFVDYFARNLDNILIGKCLGAGPLGIYSRGYALLMLPINSLRGPVNTVGLPALSRLQYSPELFRDYYKKITCYLALISMPLTAFLLISSKILIPIALGSQWKGVVPVFSILAVAGFIQPVVTLWGMVLMSLGMGKRYLRLGILNAVCTATGFIIGLQWGQIGVATSYAVVTYVTAYPILKLGFKDTPVGVADFVAAIVRPFVSSIVAALTSYSVLLMCEGRFLPLLSIIISGVGFIITYMGVLRVLPGGSSDYRLIIGVVSILRDRLRMRKQSVS